jgi:hypothetical protein
MKSEEITIHTLLLMCILLTIEKNSKKGICTKSEAQTWMDKFYHKKNIYNKLSHARLTSLFMAKVL